MVLSVSPSSSACRVLAAHVPESEPNQLPAAFSAPQLGQAIAEAPPVRLYSRAYPEVLTGDSGLGARRRFAIAVASADIGCGARWTGTGRQTTGGSWLGLRPHAGHAQPSFELEDPPLAGRPHAGARCAKPLQQRVPRPHTHRVVMRQSGEILGDLECRVLVLGQTNDQLEDHRLGSGVRIQNRLREVDTITTVQKRMACWTE